jgi:hypothetical protein
MREGVEGFGAPCVQRALRASVQPLWRRDLVWATPRIPRAAWPPPKPTVRRKSLCAWLPPRIRGLQKESRAPAAAWPECSSNQDWSKSAYTADRRHVMRLAPFLGTESTLKVRISRGCHADMGAKPRLGLRDLVGIVLGDLDAAGKDADGGYF